MLKNLVKLYVRDNQVQSLQNIDSAPKLTHLYIINNDISELDSVARLPYIEKLYAGRNRIQVIEGLENMENLCELHIENQKLFPGEKMHLEPESLSALSRLQVLNISNNKIDNIEFIRSLTNLNSLRCEDNHIHDLVQLTVLKNCKKLQKVYLRGNPISKETRYRDHVIMNVWKISELDEREINQNEVDFIRNWNQFKLDQESKTNLQSSAAQNKTHVYLSQADIENIANGLPSGYAHISELIKKRNQETRIEPEPSLSEPSVKKTIFPLQSRSLRDSRLTPDSELIGRMVTPDAQAGGGDVSPVKTPIKPKTPLPSNVDHQLLVIENTPSSR